jgi:hypothetical protein
VHIYGNHATDPTYQTFHNILNAFKDDCEDGFYTCMERKAMFPALIYLKSGYNVYDIEFSSTVPDK